MSAASQPRNGQGYAKAPAHATIPRMHVSLFVTCLTDLFSPQVGMDVVRVLEHFGCTVDFPAAQTCCGQPQFNNGFLPEARTLAERMIGVFEKSTMVVTPSGSCCSMLREHYPGLFKDDAQWEPRALALAAKTYEFVEFLTKILKVDFSELRLPRETTLTYHYNCHLRGLGQAPEICAGIAGKLGNASFVPLPKAEQCCGFGGTFSTKYPDISGAMVRDKVENVRRTGAGTLIVNDAGCAMNIGGACHRSGADFRVKHLAELLAEAINAQGTREAAP